MKSVEVLEIRSLEQYFKEGVELYSSIKPGEVLPPQIFVVKINQWGILGPRIKTFIELLEKDLI
jgi:hypothetical protein